MTTAEAFEDNFAELLAWYASFGGETVHRPTTGGATAASRSARSTR